MNPSQKSTDLIAALELVLPLLRQTLDTLTPVLPALSDEQRSSCARPPHEFLAAAPALVQAMATRPAIAAVVPFDGADVSNRIQAASTITQLQSILNELSQVLADGRLMQLSEAWRQSLGAYQIAKQKQRQDPTLRQVTEPLATIFNGRRMPAESAETPDASVH